MTSQPDPEHGVPDADTLSHIRGDGSSHMVDVTDKAVTKRRAVAEGWLITRADVVAQIVDGSLPKGEAISVARVAGILGAKQTSALIPLCHPLPISGVQIDIEPHGDRMRVVAAVKTTGVTGVEMEALTAVSIAALTLYDMIKAVDRAAVLTDIRVLEKEGGKSGAWRAV